MIYLNRDIYYSVMGKRGRPKIPEEYKKKQFNIRLLPIDAELLRVDSPLMQYRRKSRQMARGTNRMGSNHGHSPSGGWNPSTLIADLLVSEMDLLLQVNPEYCATLYMSNMLPRWCMVKLLKEHPKLVPEGW